MPNVVFPNLTPASFNHSFSHMWALSRALIKAGWTYLKSSDGVTIDATGNPANDKWGAPTSTGNTGAAAVFSSKTLDDITVTGLTGMSSSSVGRFLTITGAATGANNGTFQIVAYVSATSVRIRNAAGVAPDANNGAITWTERDHVLQTYPTSLDAAAAWILLQGPSTLKIPINAQPSPAFRRGEKVTQAVSLAEGEVMGVVWNTASTSFIIIQPRIGTFDNSNVITGAVSGATTTPSGIVITMVCELVLAKTTDVLNGWMFYQRVDASSESAQRFSALTPTAAIAPGNGSGANLFPTIAYTAKGAPNGASNPWFTGVTSVASGPMGLGRAQIIVPNAIGNADTSPDGSFFLVVSLPGTSSETLTGFGLSRTDDMEDGEVDPFVFLVSNSTQTRTTALISSVATWTTLTSGGFWSSNNFTHLGWRKRSYGGTGDAFIALVYPCFLSSVFRGNVMAYNQSDPDRVAATTATLNHREAIWVIDADQGERTRKGTHRWLFSIGQGAPFNLWDSKTWLQIQAANPSFSGGLVLGPWDGSTDPIYV